MKMVTTLIVLLMFPGILCASECPPDTLAIHVRANAEQRGKHSIRVRLPNIAAETNYTVLLDLRVYVDVEGKEIAAFPIYDSLNKPDFYTFELSNQVLPTSTIVALYQTPPYRRVSVGSIDGSNLIAKAGQFETVRCF